MAAISLANGQAVHFRITVGALSRLPRDLDLDAYFRRAASGSVSALLESAEIVYHLARIPVAKQQWLDSLTAADLVAIAEALAKEFNDFFQPLAAPGSSGSQSSH